MVRCTASMLELDLSNLPQSHLKVVASKNININIYIYIYKYIYIYTDIYIYMTQGRHAPTAEHGIVPRVPGPPEHGMVPPTSRLWELVGGLGAAT